MPVWMRRPPHISVDCVRTDPQSWCRSRNGADASEAYALIARSTRRHTCDPSRSPAAAIPTRYQRMAANIGAVLTVLVDEELGRAVDIEVGGHPRKCGAYLAGSGSRSSSGPSSLYSVFLSRSHVVVFS